MKSKELKGKSSEELETQLLELQKELIKINTQVATGTTLKSPGQAGLVKKNIARLMSQLKK
ncbi:TPA: 50S ribosomal protein L29 [Candidatus Woesearchaeota archaeon]|nr:hypothetical protein QT06_C0001G0548 [archaeon GW2011_AR15]MBS3103859.1 50S ribosomal protein L29 [Candidatus Woesearchaeota archaeon]HIH40815.1 50S ribosomal protein L29 [Candidatus Woesearchaeota archaeon]